MAELTPRMKELVQPYLAGIEPYDPNFTPTRINLSANENTYPVPAGVRELAGGNSHHIIEAAFKAVGRTMRRACELDPRVQGIPSTKGSL